MAEVARRQPANELSSAAYEVFIGALSLLSIVNLVLISLAADEAIDTVLQVMNGLFSVVFLLDFLHRLVKAESRSWYFLRDFGWADLLASLPFPQLKLLRLFRLERVFRMFRRQGSRAIGRMLARDVAASALMSLLLMGVLVLEFGSLAMLWIEKDAPGATITTASDAMWYVVVTISTVGYGDRYPVTTTGRVVGALIIVVGVAIFGTFTGYLANAFLAPKEHELSGPPDATAATNPDALAVPDATSRPAPVARGAVFPEQVGVDAQRAVRLQALLAQSEATASELRRLLAEATTQDPDPETNA